MNDQIPEKLVKYGKSEKGNYQVIDTIGVPHPYCIGAKHVAIASDEFGGMLGEGAIERAEQKGVYCDICAKANRKFGKPILSYKEHKQALVVACYLDPQKGGYPELQTYLKSIVTMCEQDKYEGFVLSRKF